MSIRTLRYYDEIGLLKPAKDPSSGHRMYSDDDILTLHKILSLKFIGFRLEKIREFIHKPTFDISLKVTLEFKKLMLQQKKMEIGTHKELMENHSQYKKLVEHQFQNG